MNEINRTLVPALVPATGLELTGDIKRSPPTNSTKFELLFVNGLPGLADHISKCHPEMAGVFGNEIVLKIPGSAEDENFGNIGAKARESLEKEAEADRRQEKIGMSSTLGMTWVKEGKEGIKLYPDKVEGAVRAKVMPKFRPEHEFAAVVKQEMSLNDKKSLMEQAVTRLMAIKAEIPEEEARVYGGLLGTDNLITETAERAIDWSQYPVPEEVRDSRKDSQSILLQMLNQLMRKPEAEQFFENGVVNGEVGDQHGDSRPFDNAFVVKDKNGKSVFIWSDPARLWINQFNRWSTFHLTHDHLQLGLLLARSYTDQQHHDWFKIGLEAFFKNKNEISPETQLGPNWLGKIKETEKQVIGLGLAYGMLVEIIVLNYGGDKSPHGPKVNDYWKSIRELSESQFLGWERK